MRQNLIGEKFDRLLVISDAGRDKNSHQGWLCRCDCGVERVVRGSALKTGFVKSCGCLRLQNLVGQRFDRLLVISKAGTDKGRKSVWLCRCICGVEKVCRGSDLKNGATKSCGCLHRQIVTKSSTTHGQSKTPEYLSYQGAKDRCTNPNNPYYKDYGARGIKFLFNNYEEFIAQIGPRPSKEYSLDRINNDGHYQPGNVRWATCQSQSRNRRNTRRLTYKDETLCVAEWAEKLGFNYNTINQRLHVGWSVERALSTPVRAMARANDPQTSKLGQLTA